jgi:hypothetical protein
VVKKGRISKKNREHLLLVTQNIYSGLDLSKCLKDFQKQVMKLLEINNIPQWNGHTFKSHEEKIREPTLIWRNLLLQQ